MKAKDWKMYVCLIVFSLFMFPGIYAAQEKGWNSEGSILYSKGGAGSSTAAV